MLTCRVRPWVYKTNGYLNVAETLRQAMTRNPHLKVWISNGYFDMATPYFATEYTVNHMYLKPEIRKNLSMTYYEAGHMMYIHLPSLIQFKKDFTDFISSAY
jgi:carboxypeptidase C (cathepsin A)